MLEVEYVDIDIDLDDGRIMTRLTNGWLLVQRFDWWLERGNEVAVRVKGTDLHDCDVWDFSNEENAFLNECEFDESMIAEHILKSDVYEEAIGIKPYFLGDWV